MSTTSMAIFSNPLFASYSVYARNAQRFNSHVPTQYQIGVMFSNEYSELLTLYSVRHQHFAVYLSNKKLDCQL